MIDEQPELCLILDDGDTGIVRAQNIALEWNQDDGWIFIWNIGGYNGPVDGTVDGIDVTFSGDADGIEVQGTVRCLEP